jgi:hypothetical protein
MPRLLRSLAAVLTATALTAGCGGGGGDADTAGGDSTAPAVTYVTPSNRAEGVGTHTPVTVSFSKPMNRESLAAAVTLVDANTGTTLPLQGVRYDEANKIATVTPSQPLPADGSVRATVSTAAKDANGNALDAEYAWTFGTAVGADTTAPAVSSHSPADGATQVPLNAHVAMSFSEPMDAVSLDRAFVLRRAGVPVAGKLAYIGQAAVFTTEAPLAPQADYVATLSRSATDLAGNRLAADHVWVFSTAATGQANAADRTPPRVLAVTPPPEATAVPRNASLSATFDEPIYPFVYGKIDGEVVAVAIDYNTQTVTLQPGAPLRSGSGYQARVSVMDLAGNLMPEPYRWSFDVAP